MLWYSDGEEANYHCKIECLPVVFNLGYSPRQTLTSSTHPIPYPFERQAATCQKFVFYFAEFAAISFFLSLSFQKTLTLKKIN